MRIWAIACSTLLAAQLLATDQPAAAPSWVKRDDKRVWIEGTKELRWGKTEPHTLLGALSSATAPTTWPCDYAALEAWSGVAFRLRWYRALKEEAWHGVSPVVEFPEEMDAITRATGWRFDVRSGDAAQMADAIRKSIDDGRCVLGYVDQKDVGLIYGYTKNGGGWSIQDYYTGPREVPLVDPQALMFFIRRDGKPLSPRDALVQGLQMGVDNWKRGEIPAEQILPWGEAGKAKLCYGEAAYEQMTEDLKNAGGLQKGPRDNLHHVRAWVADNLRDARGNGGAKFLKANASLLGERAQPHLLKAAEFYGQISGKIGPAMGAGEAFTFDKPEMWNDTMREKEIAILKECKELDGQAIGEIEKALEVAEAGGK